MLTLCAFVGVDSVRSTSILGSGLFVQSLQARRHFTKADEGLNRFFSPDPRDAEMDADHGNEGSDGDDGAELPATSRRRDPVKEDPSELSWLLGYSFAHPSASSSSAPAPASALGNDQHSARVGLAWDGFDSLEIGVSGGYAAVPERDYRQGSIGFRLQYAAPVSVWFPERRKSGPREDDNDARLYYLRKSRAARPVPVPPYPRLRAALDVEFMRHLRATSSGELSVSQYAVGPELDLALDDRLSFRLAGQYWGYSSPLGSITAGLGLAGGGTAYRFPAGSRLAFVPQVLSFAEVVAEQGVSYGFAQGWRAELSANQVFYGVFGQDPVFGFVPGARATIGESWEAGAAVAIFAGGVTAGLLGIVDVGYGF